MSFRAARRALERELLETWLGLDRLGTTELDLLPATMPQRFGSECWQRTSEMMLLEREADGSGEDFWQQMARVFLAFFQWQLSDMGLGPFRSLLWQGTALLQRNLSFALQTCAPAAGAFALLAVERWMSRSTDALVGLGDPTGPQPAETLKTVASEYWKIYWELNGRMRGDGLPSPMWAEVLSAGEQRIRHRMRTVNALGTPRDPHLPSGELAHEDLRWQVELYQCHAKVGPGVVPFVISHPKASRRLLRAGRIFRSGPVQRSRPPRRKLAFLFMVYSEVGFPRLWRQFFETAPANRFKILLHVSKEPNEIGSDAQAANSGRESCGTSGLSESSFFDQYKIAWQPSEWCSIHRVLFGLLEAALEDPAVEKAILLSEDSVPLVSFSKMYQWALSDRGRSWFCLDPELPRAEAWQLLDRGHLELLVRQRASVEQLLVGSGMCDGEELLLMALLLLGQWPLLRARCVAFAQWALPKYFAIAQPPLLGRPQPLAEDAQRRWGACAHPTTFSALAMEDVERLLHNAGPEGGWFARKFARQATVDLGDGRLALLEDVLLILLAR